MDVTCERCQTEYEFDDALVSDQGTSVRCTQCGHRFKVKRRDGAAAPEVWIVRTVDGQALEFRALRELKSAISSGKVGRDDVLSRGAGRPRRLASIAELEPFFVSTPTPMASTNIGLGAVETSTTRARSATPSGLGPVQAPPANREHSVAIPLPSLRGEGSAINVPPPTPSGSGDPLGFDEEVTQSRSLTRELTALGAEPPPPSREPPTLMEPYRDRDAAPKTLAGVAPRDAPDAMREAVARGFVPAAEEPPRTVTRTVAFGTPASADASLPDAAPGSAARVPESLPEPSTARRPGSTPDAAAAAEAPPREEPRSRVAPSGAVAAKDEPPPSAKPAASDEGARGQVLPPEPVGTASPVEQAPTPTPSPPPVAEEEPASESRPSKKKGRARVSLVTPPPPEARYSITHDEVEPLPSDRRTSLFASRRSPGSMRLIVGLLVGGVMIFLGILLVQRYVKKGAEATASADPRIATFLEEGERALREGDFDGAKSQFDRASGISESDPRVAKASARLAVIRAEGPWLKLLLLPANDAGRDAVKAQYDQMVAQATSAVDRARALAKDDPEVTRARIDVLRLVSKTQEARALLEQIGGLDGQPDTDIAKAALDLSEQKPQWQAVVSRLTQAAEREGKVGRARALLVYALARSGDPAGARRELGQLPKAHPLLEELTRFVERAEKGENVALRVEDLPTVGTSVPATSASAPASSSAPPVDSAGATSSLRAAQEALARGELTKAESLYEGVLKSEPGNLEALLGRATVAQRQGQAPLATQYYQKALDVSPGNTNALLNLADLKWKSGDQAGAKALYKRALDGGITGEAATRARERVSGVSSSSTDTPPPGPPPTQSTSSSPPPPPPPPPPPSTSDVPAYGE